MADMPSGGKGSALAPGMTQVVHAGTTYEIVDEKGVTLEIVARNDPAVMAFLIAFDEWAIVDRTMPKQGAEEVRRAAWHNMVKAWEAIPGYVVNEFPSMKQGIVLPANVAVEPHAHGLSDG